MNLVNALLTAAADRVMSPLEALPPVVVLLLLSAVIGILMAFVFRYTSRQQALRRAAEQSRAQVLAIKLFKDDLGTMFRSLSQLLRYTGLRLWYSLPPVLVMMVPFILLLTQLARWYEHYPLSQGDTAVVQLELTEGAWPQSRSVAIQALGPVDIETRPLRDTTEHAVFWRIRADEPGPTTLRWQFGDQQIDKRVAVAADQQAFCPVDVRRPGASWWDRLLHPGEPGLAADSPVCGIVVQYLPRTTPVLGLDLPWWLTFVLVSILAAVLVRPVVGVHF
jgi:hypothetical protein